MAKLKNDSITAQDMADFVSSDSDFTLEMRVLERLTSLGFVCSHSGTYRDPVTEKIRQYDIRATKVAGDFQLSMAVECKNFRPNFPLLISAVPRTSAEAFHDQIILNSRQYTTPVMQTHPTTSVYKVGEMVGKKTDQVGRDSTSGVLFSNDEATFEKLNQAVNSCQDLVRDSAYHGRSTATIRVVLPMLVIPTNILWQVDYFVDGSQQIAARPVPRSNFFLNHPWQAQTGLTSQMIDYRLSHLELVTFGSLAETLEGYFAADGFFAK